MACPHLDYRTADDEHEFDHERPYCAVLDEFVSPMRADICNDRFDFHHAEDCEVFKANDVAAETTAGAATTVDAESGRDDADVNASEVDAVLDADRLESDGSTTD